MKKTAHKRNHDGARKELVGQNRDRQGKGKPKPKEKSETINIPMYSGYVGLPTVPGHPERPKYQHVITLAAIYDMQEGTMEILYLFGFHDMKRALASNKGKAIEGGLEQLGVKQFHFLPFNEDEGKLPIMFNFSNFYSAKKEFLYSEVKSTMIWKEEGEFRTETKKVKYTSETHTPKVINVAKATSYWAIDAVNTFMQMEMFTPTTELKQELDRMKGEAEERKRAKAEAEAEAPKAEAEAEAKPINRNARKFDISTLRAVSGALKAAGYNIHVIYNTKEDVLEVLENAPARTAAPCVTNLGDVLNEAAIQA